MKVIKRKSGLFLFCALVVISIFLFYTAYNKKEQALNFNDLADVFLVKDINHTLSELNKVAALAGIGLLSIAIAIGPLAILFPGIFREYVWWRKFLGLTGVTLILIHALYAISIHYRFSVIKMFIKNEKVWGVIMGLLALLIFLAMAATSNSAAIRAFGAKRWKVLHRFGYLALISGAMHFIIMETKSGGLIEIRPYGWVFLYLPFITLFLKMTSMVYQKVRITLAKPSSS